MLWEIYVHTRKTTHQSDLPSKAHYPVNNMTKTISKMLTSQMYRLDMSQSLHNWISITAYIISIKLLNLKKTYKCKPACTNKETTILSANSAVNKLYYTYTTFIHTILHKNTSHSVSVFQTNMGKTDAAICKYKHFRTTCSVWSTIAYQYHPKYFTFLARKCFSPPHYWHHRWIVKNWKHVSRNDQSCITTLEPCQKQQRENFWKTELTDWYHNTPHPRRSH